MFRSEREKHTVSSQEVDVHNRWGHRVVRLTKTVERSLFTPLGRVLSWSMRLSAGSNVRSSAVVHGGRNFFVTPI